MFIAMDKKESKKLELAEERGGNTKLKVGWCIQTALAMCWTAEINFDLI